MPISSFQEFFIQWHLTERCNLNCLHCYQTGSKTSELSLDEITATLDEITEMLDVWQEIYQLEFSPSFNVTGGEPLLRKDLFNILERMSSNKFKVYLLTNGTLIDSRVADQLAGQEINGIQVSIEGPEEIHDTIRGKGSFEAACRGVECLVRSGLNVTLNATLSSLNAEQLPAIVDIASSLGAQRLGFSRLVPSGKGLGLVDRMVDSRRIKEIYQSVLSLCPENLEIVTGDPIATQLKDEAETKDFGSHAFGGCSAAISGLTILHDGTVTPCRRLPIPLGNVRTDSLREIWANSETLEQLRDRSQYKGKCGGCPRWAVCRGCRAIAHAFSLAQGEDDFLAEDPQCFITCT